jgi:hypothetical protein
MWGGRVQSELAGRVLGPVAVSYEHNNEPLAYTKRGEILDYLSDCSLRRFSKK